MLTLRWRSTRGKDNKEIDFTCDLALMAAPFNTMERLLFFSILSEHSTTDFCVVIKTC